MFFLFVVMNHHIASVTLHVIVLINHGLMSQRYFCWCYVKANIAVTLVYNIAFLITYCTRYASESSFDDDLPAVKSWQFDRDYGC